MTQYRRESPATREMRAEKAARKLLEETYGRKIEAPRWFTVEDAKGAIDSLKNAQIVAAIDYGSPPAPFEVSFHPSTDRNADASVLDTLCLGDPALWEETPKDSYRQSIHPGNIEDGGIGRSSMRIGVSS